MTNGLKRLRTGFEEVSVKGGWEAYDDVKGGRLPYKLVKEARQEEVRYMTKRGCGF